MRRASPGLSLIELLVTITILGIGLVSLSGLFVGGIVSSTKAQRVTAAINAAQQELEKMRSAGFAGALVDAEIFPAASGYTIIQQNADGTGQVGFTVSDSELRNAEGTIDITFYDSGSGIYPNLKVVTVTVTWSGGKQTHGRVQLQTYLGNRP